VLALAKRLLARTEASGTADPDAIVRRLAAAIAEARARWPQLGEHDDVFVDAVAARVEGETDVETAMAGLALADIYLVAACEQADRGALAALQVMTRSEVARVVSRIPRAPAADDLAQELLAKLLVAPAGATPKLASFGGHGGLHAWLRVAAMRTGISMTRRKTEAPADDELLAALADDSEDQALALVKSGYRVEFKRAFAGGFAELAPRSRTLLRLQIIDQLALEDIAKFYRVSRATVARWLAAARADLVAGTRRRLIEALAIGEDELTELMRLASTTLYSTLPRLLRDTATAATPRQ
jgi:RNA polymerase sigma-70 factor, ECF subfamily